MKWGGWLHRIWWHFSDKLPTSWLPIWRPVCWWLRHEHTDSSYGYCVICRASM